MSSASVAVPTLISDLVGRGIWPATPEAARTLTFDLDVVRSVAADERMLWLSPPPFHILAADNPDWFDQFRHPAELDYESALILGDFGPGSDNPIVLDTASSPHRVMALSFTAQRGTVPSAQPGRREEAMVRRRQLSNRRALGRARADARAVRQRHRTREV